MSHCRRRPLSLFLAGWVLGLGLSFLPSARGAAVYCNITDISFKELSNGIQIVIQADGVLDYGGYSANSSKQFTVYFPNAKSLLGKSFIDVDKYPVSYLQICVPQGAAEGVGVNLTVSLINQANYRVSYNNERTLFYITAYSDRTLEKSYQAKAGAASPVTAKGIEVTQQNGLLSVRCLQADIQQVLAKIAQVAGLNLAVDDGVQHEVSLNLEQLPPDTVIRSIAGAYGLALAEVDGVYKLSEGIPTDLSSYRLSGTQSFPLHYTRASEASGLLPTFLYSYLHVNQPQNAVVAAAPGQMLEKIGKDLQTVDIPPPQIMIDALAVEFASSADIDKVVTLRAGDITGVGDLSGLSGSALDDALQGFSDSRTGGVHFSNLRQLPSDFEARLRALVSQGKAQVEASPRMAAMNGYQANLFIGQRRFIRVQYLIGDFIQEKIQTVDVGVKLSVTPWTGGGGEITVAVSPEVSNVSEVDLATGLPLLSQRNASTKVRVKDGETVMIGGLTQKQVFDTQSKIPVLGDLPLVGGLFRSRKKNQSNSELVIFLTPHVLTAEGRLPDEAKEKEIRDKFLKQ
jgi:type II secretory pathway component GspD/PulD (secretin)